MQALRDILIQQGLTAEIASLIAVTAAILLSLFIGWFLRALASGPLARYLITSEPWQDALKEYNVWSRSAMMRMYKLFCVLQ